MKTKTKKKKLASFEEELIAQAKDCVTRYNHVLQQLIDSAVALREAGFGVYYMNKYNKERDSWYGTLPGDLIIKITKEY